MPSFWVGKKRFYKAILSVLFDMVVISVGPSLSCAGTGRTRVRQAKSFVPAFRRHSLSDLTQSVVCARAV